MRFKISKLNKFWWQQTFRDWFPKCYRRRVTIKFEIQEDLNATEERTNHIWQAHEHSVFIVKISARKEPNFKILLIFFYTQN
jgi:hypothetical protein